MLSLKSHRLKVLLISFNVQQTFDTTAAWATKLVLIVIGGHAHGLTFPHVLEYSLYFQVDKLTF